MRWVSIEPRPGEVWAVDFWAGGQAAARSDTGLSPARRCPGFGGCGASNLQLRGLRGEVDIGKPRWLPKRSAVNIQGFAGIDQHALIRKLGRLSDEQFSAVKDAIREMLSPSESGLSRR